jgi:hypothetical protein
MPTEAARRASCAQRSRLAAGATRVAASFPRIGFPASGCPTPTPFRHSAAGFITPTGRCWTRSTTTARSSRARCSRQASPAAIAMSRTAPSFAVRARAYACNAIRPTSMRLSHTISMRRRTRRFPALLVICRPGPTWSSIRGTITASGFRGLTCRRSSARPMLAMIAIRTNRPIGPLRRLRAGMGRTGRAFRTTPRHSMRRGPDRRTQRSS